MVGFLILGLLQGSTGPALSRQEKVSFGVLTLQNLRFEVSVVVEVQLLWYFWLQNSSFKSRCGVFLILYLFLK